MNKRQAWSAIVAVATAWLIWAIISSNLIPKRFASVAVGDSREEVFNKLGRPRRVERCGEPFGNPGGKLGCKEDFLYSSPFAPLIPEYWSISLDREGKVIDKYHYVSP